MVQRLPYDEFKSIYSRVPRLCVEVVVMTPEGVVLTLRTLPDWNNMWHFPGGTVLMGETIAEAARRVAKEEIGVEVEVGQVLGYMEFPSEKEVKGWGQIVSIVFQCTPKSMDFVPDEGASEVKVFSQLPQNMIGEHKAFLESHSLWQGRSVDTTAQPQ